MSSLVTYLNLARGEVKYRTIRDMRKFFRNSSPAQELKRTRPPKRRIAPNGMKYTLYRIVRQIDNTHVRGNVIYCHEYNVSFIVKAALKEVIDELDYIQQVIEKTSEEVTVVN